MNLTLPTFFTYLLYQTLYLYISKYMEQLFDEKIQLQKSHVTNTFKVNRIYTYLLLI